MTIHNTLEDTSSQAEELILNLTSETSDPSIHLTALDYFLYPEICTISDDPDFDYSPIIPKESSLNQLIELHGKI